MAIGKTLGRCYDTPMEETLYSNDLEIISTTDFVPGREVQENLGLVTGVGTSVRGIFMTNIVHRAIGKAITDMSWVKHPNANAIISLNVATTKSGFPFIRSVTVILTGTQVVLKK